MLGVLIDTIRDWVKSVLANFYGMYLGYITPEMFGAKGDGVTDDTTAVNNAISAAASQGTYVKFLPKTYIVNRLVFVNNMTLVGENTTITTNENKTAKLTQEQIYDVNITGITFDNFSEINLKFSARVVFEGCKFINNGKQVFTLQFVKRFTFRNCLFENIGHDITDASTSGKAIEVIGRADTIESKITNRIFIENCEFSKIYGGKAIKMSQEVSNFRIVGNTFHDLTYGCIGLWTHACTEDSFNIISDNLMYNIGTFEVAPNDENGKVSASGATAIYAYTKDSLVTNDDGTKTWVLYNHQNIVCTRNTMRNLAENAIEGAFKEISYNIIDTTGIIVGREKDKGNGGIYVPYEAQNIHHNRISNCPNGGRGIYVHANYVGKTAKDIRICNNVITKCSSNSIRVQGYIDGITILDNEVDGDIELVPHKDYMNYKSFYYRQPAMFESWKRIRYDEGWVDIEGDCSRKDGWKVSGNITTNADGNMIIPPNASISQTFERNLINDNAPNGLIHCVVRVTYSFNDIIGTTDCMKIKINDDTRGRSELTFKGLYTETPEEKEYITRNYILLTNSTSKDITVTLKNVFTGTGNVEIKDIQVKMVKGINSISTLSDVVETPIDFTAWEE